MTFERPKLFINLIRDYLFRHFAFSAASEWLFLLHMAQVNLWKEKYESFSLRVSCLERTNERTVRLLNSLLFFFASFLVYFSWSENEQCFFAPSMQISKKENEIVCAKWMNKKNQEMFWRSFTHLISFEEYDLFYYTLNSVII